MEREEKKLDLIEIERLEFEQLFGETATPDYEVREWTLFKQKKERLHNKQKIPRSTFLIENDPHTQSPNHLDINPRSKSNNYYPPGSNVNPNDKHISPMTKKIK